MQVKGKHQFFLISIVGLLFLMPLWYFLAPVFAVPVFFIAGKACVAIFYWVLDYQVDGVVGMLKTSIKLISQHQGQVRLGNLAPQVDYRVQGYGMAIFWSLVLASRLKSTLRNLLVGTVIMIVLQSAAIIMHWLNDVLNKSGSEALMQTRLPSEVAEVVAFGFHFNLFIFTTLLPILVWMALSKDFVKEVFRK